MENILSWILLYLKYEVGWYNCLSIDLPLLQSVHIGSYEESYCFNQCICSFQGSYLYVVVNQIYHLLKMCLLVVIVSGTVLKYSLKVLYF